MSNAILCPRCQNPFDVTDDLAGRLTNCKHCGQPFFVPGSASHEHSDDRFVETTTRKPPVRKPPGPSHPPPAETIPFEQTQAAANLLAPSGNLPASGVTALDDDEATPGAWRFSLLRIGLWLVFAAGMCDCAAGLSLLGSTIGLAGTPYLVVLFLALSTLSGAPGMLLCLFAPRQTGRWAVTLAVGLQLGGIALGMFAGQRIVHLEPASGFAELVIVESSLLPLVSAGMSFLSLVSFIVFARHLALYLDEDLVADQVLSFLVALLVAPLLMVLTLAIASVCTAVLAAILVLMTLVMYVILFVYFVRYLLLIKRLAETIPLG